MGYITNVRGTGQGAVSTAGRTPDGTPLPPLPTVTGENQREETYTTTNASNAGCSGVRCRGQRPPGLASKAWGLSTPSPSISYTWRALDPSLNHLSEICLGKPVKPVKPVSVVTSSTRTVGPPAPVEATSSIPN